jgi:hypothetical protein
MKKMMQGLNLPLEVIDRLKNVADERHMSMSALAADVL